MLFYKDYQHSQRIIRLALPIIGGMLSQSLLNLVDAALVGLLGDQALAAVGLGSYVNFFIVALVLGFSASSQALVARCYGQQRWQHCALPLNGGLLMALLLAVPLTFICWLLAPRLLGVLNNNPTVAAIGSEYFQARILGLVAVAMSFCFRGYWNGMQRPAAYLRILLLVQLVNVVLSYGLIFGQFGLPKLGAAGAGWGTTISLYSGVCCYLLLTLKQGRQHGFLKDLPSRKILWQFCRLATPTSIQQFLFALGIALLFWIIGRLGVAQVAVAHVLLNLSLLLVLPAIGMGMATATLVSQALGSHQPDKAKGWGWSALAIGIPLLLILSLPLYIWPTFILGLFLHQPALVELGKIPLFLTGLSVFTQSAAIILAQALLGAGANKQVLAISVTAQWLLLLPLAWLVGDYWGYGLTGIWLLQLCQQCILSVIYIRIWYLGCYLHTGF
jgi:putative MATE family efflux protein